MEDLVAPSAVGTVEQAPARRSLCRTRFGRAEWHHPAVQRGRVLGCAVIVMVGQLAVADQFHRAEA